MLENFIKLFKYLNEDEKKTLSELFVLLGSLHDPLTALNFMNNFDPCRYVPILVKFTILSLYFDQRIDDIIKLNDQLHKLIVEFDPSINDTSSDEPDSE